MMVYTMLCRSRAMRAGRVRAAAVVIGGMGKSFADGCTSPARVPLMILHGAKDEHIPYNRPVVLDYVPFMSTGGCHNCGMHVRQVQPYEDPCAASCLSCLTPPDPCRCPAASLPLPLKMC
jgi:hypothetical protein